MSEPRVLIIIADVPAEIRECVEAEALARNRPFSWIVAEALGERLGLPFEPSYTYKRPSKAHRSQSMWVMRVPAHMRIKLKKAAEKERTTVRAFVLATLAAHCDVVLQDENVSLTPGG